MKTKFPPVILPALPYRTFSGSGFVVERIISSGVNTGRHGGYLNADGGWGRFDWAKRFTSESEAVQAIQESKRCKVARVRNIVSAA